MIRLLIFLCLWLAAMPSVGVAVDLLPLAELETGASVNVPLFVEEGDIIRVDRTEDKYLTRVTG